MTYNHAEFIRACMESILIQKTTFPVEIVVGDDFSTDRTLEIIREFKNTEMITIKILERSFGDSYWIKRKKLGRLYNFINIIENCSGEYIALLDGDDYWTDPNKLQKQVDFLDKNPDCVSSHHWHKYSFPNSNGDYVEISAPTENEGYLPVEKSTVREIFANKLRIKLRTHVFRNIIKEYPEWLFEMPFGDVPLSMILGKYGNFGFIDEPMAVYRQTGKGVSSFGNENFLYRFQHTVNWIKIWEQGLIHYDYQFEEEAVAAIREFYFVIISRYGFTKSVFFKTLNFLFFKSKLKTGLRFYLFGQIMGEYMRNAKNRLT